MSETYPKNIQIKKIALITMTIRQANSENVVNAEKRCPVYEIPSLFLLGNMPELLDAST
jgi:hypothetical protein